MTGRRSNRKPARGNYNKKNDRSKSFEKSPVRNSSELKTAFESKKLDRIVWAELTGLFKRIESPFFMYQTDRWYGDVKFVFRISRTEGRYWLQITQKMNNSPVAERSVEFSDVREAVYECLYLKHYAGRKDLMPEPIPERKKTITGTAENSVRRKVVVVRKKKKVTQTQLSKSSGPAPQKNRHPVRVIVSRKEPDIGEKITSDTSRDYSDPKQSQVINAPGDSNLLVEAPPGTGKTWCLVKRLRRMVEELPKDEPADSIVVLSFTNAAVDEITRRIKEEVGEGAQDRLRYVNVRTFDKFASWILSEVVEVDYSRSYEDVINQFNDFMSEPELIQDSEKLSRIHWLIVDEVQDLVDVRMKMVSLLTDFIVERGGFFNLFGDSQQSISDYQKKDDEGAFIPELKEKYKKKLLHIELETSYRYTDSEALEKFNRRARRIVDRNSSNPAQRYKELKQEIPGNNSSVSIDDLPERISPGETSAVLCRSNMEVHVIGNRLREQGVSIEVLRKNDVPAWPGWIALLFSGYRSERMSVSTLENRIFQRLSEEDQSLGRILEYLTMFGVFGNGIINLKELAWKISHRPKPPRLNQARSEAVISTIHRAKGLEYDNVFVLDSKRVSKEEELRIYYVAMSRARKNLHMIVRDTQMENLISWKSCRYGKRNVGYYREKNSVKEVYLDNYECFHQDTLFTHLSRKEHLHAAVSALNHSGENIFEISRNTSVRKVWNEYWLFLVQGDLKLPLMKLKFGLNRTLNILSEKYFGKGELKLQNLEPSYHITLIASEEVPFIETITGPNRFIKVPVFEGFHPVERA